MDNMTYITSGRLSTLSSATTVNCPKGRVLRETGRKLYRRVPIITTPFGCGYKLDYDGIAFYFPFCTPP